MKRFILSCLGQSDNAYAEAVQQLCAEADNYKKNYKLSIVSDDERRILDFILSTYQNGGNTPTLAYIEQVFPQTKGQFDSLKGNTVTLENLRAHLYNVIHTRLRSETAARILSINSQIPKTGLTADIYNEISRLHALEESIKEHDVTVDLDAAAIYAEKLKKPTGLITGIKALDSKIGGMDAGTVTTIAGFTSHFKSTFALNIAYLNSYFRGMNIAYITLETPKDDIVWNLLSRHSYDPKFSKYAFIGHDRMRQVKLTDDEQDYLFQTVQPDLRSPIIDDEGNAHERGRIVFLDEDDFKTFSFTEIENVLMQVDKKLNHQLDAVFVDYIQLCKFSGQSGYTADANGQINAYVTFFRRLGQTFGNGQTGRKVAIVLLSQINRENWKRAKNNEGRYDITCLADANELERGSHRVITTYTDEDMKGRNAAQVQILKNRNGATMTEPSYVFAMGEAYVYQDETDNMTSTFGGDTSVQLSTAMDDLDFGDLSALGL